MSKSFNPEFAELLSEVFFRCSIVPLDVTQEHIDEALRSANFALVKFNNKGVKEYQLVQQSIPLVAGTASYSLAAGTLDVWSAVLHRGTQDIPVWPIGRVDYQRIPSKTTQGRPFNYFVDKGQTGTAQRTITFWPSPENSTDTVTIWAWVRSDDQLSMAQTVPMAYEWLDAYAAEIAARMARKYKPDAVDSLKAEAAEAFLDARATDRDRSPTRFRMRGYSRPRGGR